MHPTLIYKSSIHGLHTHNIIETLHIVQLLNCLYNENEMNDLVNT